MFDWISFVLAKDFGMITTEIAIILTKMSIFLIEILIILTKTAIILTETSTHSQKHPPSDCGRGYSTLATLIRTARSA